MGDNLLGGNHAQSLAWGAAFFVLLITLLVGYAVYKQRRSASEANSDLQRPFLENSGTYAIEYHNLERLEFLHRSGGYLLFRGKLSVNQKTIPIRVKRHELKYGTRESSSAITEFEATAKTLPPGDFTALLGFCEVPKEHFIEAAASFPSPQSSGLFFLSGEQAAILAL